MDMRLEQTSMMLEQPIGCCHGTINVEGDVTLPGSLRETTNILHTGAMAVVESAEAAHERVTVAGRVIFRVLYTQGNSSRPEAIEATADFTQICEVKGAGPKVEVFACAQAVHAAAAVQGGRVHMKADVLTNARVMMCEPVEIITGVEMPGVQQKKQKIRLCRTVGRGNGDVLLREEFPLPAELQILDTIGASAGVQLRDAAGGQGRIGLSGEATIEAVHASGIPGKPLVVTRHTWPVTQSVAIQGENGEKLDGRMAVKDVAVASQDMGDGERTLRVEVLLGLTAWSDQKEEAELLTDAYTTHGNELRLNTIPLTVRTGEHRIHAAESGKASLLLPDGAKPMRTMLAAFAAPVLSGYSQQGSRLIAEGVLETTLVYMSDEDDTPVSVRMDVPFRTSFAASAAPEDMMTIAASGVEAVPITSDRAELRYILHLDVDGVRAESVPAVAEATEVPADVLTKDIVLYFTQPGETVWDIAKRYRVEEGELRRLNPELQGEPKIGQGVVVWHRNQE